MPCGVSVLIRPGRYPEELADRSWDNVGLLLGNSETDAKKRKPRVMVVNDLTFQVAVDAIGQGVSVIVSYRTSETPLGTYDMANSSQTHSSFLDSSPLHTMILNKRPSST
jgi:hypothetical protein